MEELLLNAVSGTTSSPDVKEYLIGLALSVICGAVIAYAHGRTERAGSNFLTTLILLPVIVQTVIMVVNGNLGTGVAVAGAFSLIRFRSMPGNSREILSVFAAMAAGLAVGAGLNGLAVVMAFAYALLSTVIGLAFRARDRHAFKDLRITIPESLDYHDVFDDIFRAYLDKSRLVRVKTTNMGSLYELQYEILEKDEDREKDMIDELRVRNGNLNIVCGRVSAANGAL